MAEEKKIKGRIELDVGDDGLLAVLNFVPDDGGTEYGLKDVNRLITEKNIVYGIDKSVLDARLSSLFDSPEETSLTVAEGDPAETAQATEYKWTEVSIPDEIKDDVERALKNAPPPEIFHVEVEKLQKQKIVKKKGLLPFGKEKEEKVVETVKQEKKVKVDVIPDLIEAGWIKAGAKIAEVKPGKAGKPGKDVFGKPIQPEAVEDEFYPGSGIEGKSGSLMAAEAGILRRGWNWVEVIPFKLHDWSLVLSKDKNTCLLNFNPGGSDSSPPDAEEILKQAEELGCSAEKLLGLSEIRGMIHTAIETGKELKSAVISTDEDGFFEIKISDDNLKAELVLHKGRGHGKPLVLKQVGSAIKTSGLKGMDLKKIQELILEFQYGSGTDEVITLCEGAAAEQAETGDMVYELEFLKDNDAEEIKKRSESMPGECFSELDSASDYPPSRAARLAMVQAEQVIAKLPVSDGKKGTDVYGKEIDIAAVDFSNLRALENIKISEGVISSLEKGLLEIFEEDGLTSFRVRPHADAELKVSLSADKMTATISASPAVGTGAPPSLEEANRLIALAGVTNGIDAEAVRSVVDKCREGDSVAGALIALGKAPKNAGETKLKWLIKLATGEAVTIDESGKANYRNQNKMTSAKEGDILAEIRKIGGDSEDGWNVCGATIPAKKVTPLNIDVGANIKEETDENGDIFLIAGKSGRVIFEKNRLEIQEALNIKGDVDFSSGNIKFSGDINIKGNVKSGFFVMAGGDIKIGMNSEMSLLSSEKSIAVAQGVKGGGKAILRAKENIQLSFAERATLLAVENISVKNAIFSCRVKCNGRLKLFSEKGYLVGGRIQAREGIEAQNIGSLSGSKTEVSFGQDYLISDRIETEEREIAKLKERLIKIESEMRQAEIDEDKKVLKNLRLEKVKIMKIMEKRSLRVFTLKERFEEHFPGEVLIRGEVFPGVVFESHGRTLEINQKDKGVKIIFNQETGFLEKVSLED